MNAFVYSDSLINDEALISLYRLPLLAIARRPCRFRIRIRNCIIEVL